MNALDIARWARKNNLSFTYEHIKNRFNVTKQIACNAVETLLRCKFIGVETMKIEGRRHLRVTWIDESKYNKLMINDLNKFIMKHCDDDMNCDLSARELADKFKCEIKETTMRKNCERIGVNFKTKRKPKPVTIVKTNNTQQLLNSVFH
jgi:hypothetical protein